ncbi:MAG: glycosyltransferase family 39 protein [Dehalococcoidia bacterium]|nr:glycosyltransferase family 39 protein [Dehalococcoidia bacterium]
MTPRAGALWAIPLFALAFAVRVLGLSSLQVSGDAAWSVFLALKDVPDLVRATAIDSHPPFYYLLLHFWTAGAGISELSVRFLSASTGLLTVAVTYKLGQRLMGTGRGVLAGVLAAISPFLVYFDRLPRMYSLLALLGVLMLYLAVRLLERPSRLLLGLYLAASLASLYTHYYGIFIVAVGFLAVSAGWRRRPGMLLVWAGVHVGALVLFLPWILYILGPSVTSTTQEYASIGLGRPANVLTFLGRFWIALNVGDMWEVGQSRLLAVGLLAPWVAGLLMAVRRGWGARNLRVDPLLLVPAGLVVLPAAANALVFVVSPYVPFTRQILLSTPAYLLLLAWVLGEIWQGRKELAVLGSGLVVAVMVYALSGTLYVEAHAADIESVDTARLVGRLRGPQDAIIFLAPWNAGYYRLVSGDRTAGVHALGDIALKDMPAFLQNRSQLWLAMLDAGKRDSFYPIEEWLDRSGYKASEYWNGRIRILLYGGRPDPALEPVGADFGEGLRLDAAGMGQQLVHSGEVVRLFLRWQALKEVGRKYVVFVHLVDDNGRGCSGRDSEPVDGLEPTESWTAGEVVDDRRGLLVGPGVPPGRYHLAVGLYSRDDPAKRLIIQGTGKDEVLLGPLQVMPQPSQSRQNPVAVSGPLGLELLDYHAEPGRESQVVRNVDGPVDLWLPASFHPGESFSVELHWRSQRPLSEAYRLRLEMTDASGRVIGQAGEGVLGGSCPSFRWIPGEIVSDRLEISVGSDVAPGRYDLQATLYPQQGGTPVADPLVFGSLDIESK